MQPITIPRLCAEHCWPTVGCPLPCGNGWRRVAFASSSRWDAQSPRPCWSEWTRGEKVFSCDACWIVFVLSATCLWLPRPARTQSLPAPVLYLTIPCCLRSGSCGYEIGHWVFVVDWNFIFPLVLCVCVRILRQWCLPFYCRRIFWN